MKILSGKFSPTSGNLSITASFTVGTLSQDQFAFEEYSVIDAVIMGGAELWKVKQERDTIYANPDMSEADGMRVADLETDFAEWMAIRRKAEQVKYYLRLVLQKSITLVLCHK